MDKEIKYNPLVSKKIMVKPVKRRGSWISQLTNVENHDGSFMYSGSTVRLRGIPYSNTLRRRVDVLNEEEQKFFESKEVGLGLSQGDLSVYRDKDNYWDKFEVKLEKNGMILDLSDPMDYIRYKFLLAQKEMIAPSWEERFDKGTYKYALVDEDVQVKSRVAKRNRINAANKVFSRMEDSADKMIDFLNIYYAGSKAVSENSKRDFLISEIDSVIERDLDGFLKVADDPNYDIKAFINRCMRRDLIVKQSTGEYYIQGEEDVFTMRELIEFLSDKKNQSIYGVLKAQLEQG